MVKNKKTIQFIGVDCILMVILTLLDQWTKSLVVHHLKDQSDIILIPGVFQLHYLENPWSCVRHSAESENCFCDSDDYLSGCSILVFASLSEKRTLYIAAYYSISSDSGSPGELYRSAPPGICGGFFLFFTD